MKARDVLQDFWDQSSPDDDCEEEVAFLLAVTPEGEGVYIAPDGTLMRADADNCRCGACDTLYRLVPIEEATDD